MNEANWVCSDLEYFLNRNLCAICVSVWTYDCISDTQYVRIVALPLPLTRSRDMYRDASNTRCAAVLHINGIIMHEGTMQRFFVLKMDVGEGLSVAPLGSAGALYLWLGGESNRNVRAWMKRIEYETTWNTFWTGIYVRFVYRFELMIVYPTRNMCG